MGRGWTWLGALVCVAVARGATAQDVEPRRWTPFPTGTNVVGLGYAYTSGDISLDPVLSIEDAEVEVHTAITSYVRSFGFLGKLARFDVILPYQSARWEGLLDGAPASRRRHGLADPRVRLSVNLTGPPAAKPKEFREYVVAHPSFTVIGVGLSVQLPLGDYQEDKLLNLGQNRYTFRPQVGVLHVRGPWSYELTASSFLFTKNDEFFQDTELEQDPLYAMQGHVVRSFGGGWWAAAGGAYSWAGESEVDGNSNDDERTSLLYGCSLGFPVGRSQGMRVGYIGARTQEDVGIDSDSLFLSWSIRF